MRLRLVLVPVIALLLFACQRSETTETASAPPPGATATTATTTATPPTLPQECPPSGTCAGSACLTSITTAAATVPVDACPRYGEFQSDVDTFSWNSFIALNWPAAVKDCSADTSKSILNVKSGDGSIVVWQTYMPAEKVFVASGSKPAAWCSGNGLLAGQPRALHNEAKAVSVAAKLGAQFAAISEPEKGVLEAKGGVLTDQAGRWVRFEKFMNYDEYKTITEKGWWNKAGLKGQTVSLPTGPIGAIEIKSAWKVLTATEKASNKYFTMEATVFNTPGGDPSPVPGAVTMGLVGLHIIHKTESAPNFFWATFEHVDNDTVFAGPGAENAQTAAEPYTELKPDGTPINKGVNVKRLHPQDVSAWSNTYYQGLLAGSVFANYKLISTQWTTGGAPQGAPAWVANTMLETYVQDRAIPYQGSKTVQTTGCFSCHLNSVTSIGTNGDHSFLFLEAK